MSTEMTYPSSSYQETLHNIHQDSDTEIRTLFISGLPHDVREREIHNLFRLVKGYEGCKLSSKPGKAPVAFASFDGPEGAIAGQTALQGIRFDSAYPHVLRIEFAKANSKTKRLLDEPNEKPEFKRRRGDFPEAMPVQPFYAEPAYQPIYPSQTAYPPPGPSFPPTYSGTSYAYPPPSWSYGEDPFHPPVHHQPAHHQPAHHQPSHHHQPHHQAHHQQIMLQTRPSRTAPCSTLYVAGLDPMVPEVELARFFGGIHGFRRLKINTKEDAVFAFVEFDDVHTATNALGSCNGQIVGSLPIRMEYARSRMGEKKFMFGDGEGNKTD